MTILPGTIGEAGAWLRDGRITCTELTAALLAKADATQDSLAAFITIAHESALAAAGVADAELASGTDRRRVRAAPARVSAPQRAAALRIPEIRYGEPTLIYHALEHK